MADYGRAIEIRQSLAFDTKFVQAIMDLAMAYCNAVYLYKNAGNQDQGKASHSTSGSQPLAGFRLPRESGWKPLLL